MKTFTTKFRSSFFLLALVSTGAWAKPVAQVTEISGSVFVVKPDGKTSMLKTDDFIEDKAEVMVEEGGLVSLTDYYDSTYHLIGGTHLKFYDRSAQLKRGKTWIQCLNGKFPIALTTANGHASYKKGEFIATFDQSTSRSQFLVVNGEVDVSNVLDREMKYAVTAGTFTMVDPEVEDGVPRAPTKVGLASLNVALSEFKKLPAQIKDNVAPETEPSRAIASVDESAPKKRGEIIFIQTNRLPASVTGGTHKYFSQRAAKPLSHAPIRYIGTSWKPMKMAPRSPASVPPMAPAPKKMVDPSMNPEFEESLKRKVSEQPKFPKELNSLIEDLKSY